MIDVSRLDPQVGDFLDGLQPIAAELGAPATLEIVRFYGGARLYVPRRWTQSLDLNEALGNEAAATLCARFGPERIDIPIQPFTVKALARFVDRLREEEGLTNGQIARTLGVSWRTVTRLTGGERSHAPRLRRRADARQVDLVDWLSARRR